MKYVKLTASSNFGNVFSVIPASIFLPFLPIAPIQSLLLNLIYDTSCMSVPWDKVDEEYVEKPKNGNQNQLVILCVGLAQRVLFLILLPIYLCISLCVRLS